MKTVILSAVIALIAGCSSVPVVHEDVVEVLGQPQRVLTSVSDFVAYTRCINTQPVAECSIPSVREYSPWYGDHEIKVYITEVRYYNTYQTVMLPYYNDEHLPIVEVSKTDFRVLNP